MKVQVLYFGVLQARRGLAEESVETEAKTARELYAELQRRHSLEMPVEALRFAINDGFVATDEALREDAVVALMPPLAGG